MIELHAPMPCELNDKQIAVAAARYAPVCSMRSGGIIYELAGGKTIEYIETNDANFRTPEGIHVGSTFVEVATAGGTQMVSEEGWRHYATLPSGWNAAFPGVPDARASYRPGRNALVVALFRRQE